MNWRFKYIASSKLQQNERVKKISGEKLFWSEIRMLLHLIKQLRLDNANVNQEKSKFMDGTNQAACLKMHQVILEI